MIVRWMSRRSVWPWLALASIAACGDPPVPADETPPAAIEPAVPSMPLQALPVAVSGCEHLLAGPRCLQDRKRSIKLWLDGEWSADDFVASFDDAPLVGDEQRMDADERGVLFELEPQAAQGTIALLHADGRRFELELQPLPEAFRTARSAIKAPPDRQWTVEEARALVVKHREELPPLDAHLLDLLEPDLALHMQDYAAVLAMPWRLAAAPEPIADVVGIDLAHANAAYVAIHIMLDYAKAQAHIDALRAHPVDLDGRIAGAYWAGVLAHRIGAFEESVASFERASELAERTRHATLRSSALAEQAVVLAELGRFDEAEALARDAAARLAPDDPFLSFIRHEAAWVRMLHREDEPDLPDPSPLLGELMVHAQRRRDTVGANGIRLNLAIAASQSGAHELAERELQAVDRAHLNHIEQIFAELVLARAAQHRGNPSRARKHLERGRLLAELVGNEALVLRVRLARAELERRAGDRPAARREFEAAEAIEDRLALGIAPQAGRSAFSSARRHARAGYVELLLELGDGSAALCTVLGARARHLRSLSVRHDSAPVDPDRRARQRELLLDHAQLRAELERRMEDSWRLPGSELAGLRKRTERDLERLDALAGEAMALVEREPAPWTCSQARSAAGEHAVLTMHPTTAAGAWWLMIDRAGVVETVRVELDPAAAAGGFEDAASRALAELDGAGQLAGVTTLTVVPLGELGAVDFHALALLRQAGAPRVVYSLGLGRGRRAMLTDGSIAAITGGRADLREPTAEIEDVQAAMEPRGWVFRDAWVPADEHQPTLLHYAGHGRHAGPSGWDSALDLAGGSLTAEQIIAHQRAPAVVVLGACDAAATDARVLDGGMNIAAAFLLAGAELVIAPSRPVDDRDARALARALYRSPPGPSAANTLADALVGGLVDAQREGGRFGEWRAWGP
jgi:CHAT domain